MRRTQVYVAVREMTNTAKYREINGKLYVFNYFIVSGEYNRIPRFKHNIRAYSQHSLAFSFYGYNIDPMLLT